jgi:hypothetical protein
MRDAVIYAFALLRVKVVFVDEAQHLMSIDTPHKPTSQLDWLKTLTNRTNVMYNQKLLLSSLSTKSCASAR